MTESTSEGFDLDAAGGDTDGVIFELGGGATAVPKEEEPSLSPSIDETAKTLIDEAENFKELGNKEFKLQNYLEAYDMYTKAIEVCPCPANAEDILRQRDEFYEMEREAARSRMEDEMQRRRRKTGETTGETSKESEGTQGVVTFELKPQENGEKLAIFLNNRAATLIQLQRYEEAIKDADVAILLNPKYTKAYIRRASAFEKTERTEEALKDTKRALEIEPSNASIRKSAMRLQKIEDERLEKLKEETMAKLKDLGNSLLGNFGLSLDNFNAIQDPKTGSYSISFDQNK